MTNNNNVVNVKLLGKEYQVVCPKEKQHELMDAAILLNDKMSEIKKSGKVIGLERIAIMAALNMSYELLTNSLSHDKQNQKIADKLSEFSLKLEEKLDSVAGEMSAELIE